MPPAKSNKKFDKIQLYGIASSKNTYDMLRRISPLAIALNKRIYAPFLIEVVLLKPSEDMDIIRQLQSRYKTQVSIGILIDDAGEAYIGHDQISKFIQREYAKPRGTSAQSPLLSRFKSQISKGDEGEIDNYNPETGSQRTTAGPTTRHFDEAPVAAAPKNLPQVKSSAPANRFKSQHREKTSDAKVGSMISSYSTDIAPLGFNKSVTGIDDEITSAFRNVRGN